MASPLKDGGRGGDALLLAAATGLVGAAVLVGRLLTAGAAAPAAAASGNSTVPAASRRKSTVMSLLSILSPSGGHAGGEMSPRSPGALATGGGAASDSTGPSGESGASTAAAVNQLHPGNAAAVAAGLVPPPPATRASSGSVIARKPSLRGGEDPWISIEGKTDFALGATRELPGAGIEKVLLLEVPRLQDIAPAHNAAVPNVRRRGDWSEEARPVPYISFTSDESFVLGDIVRSPHKQKPLSRAYTRAGVRATTYFDPSKVKAAVVTCGGLCPGLNNVIREVVDTLYYCYGVDTIVGVQNGYWGFHTPDADTAPVRSPNAPTHEPPLLTPASVAKVHNYGGTVLGSDRGGHDVDVILRFCENRGVNQLYILGGDGTHRGAHAIHVEAAKRGLPLAVAAIPKTIDNDVDIIDRSFGFDTAFSEAQRAIKTAKTEAAGAPNGIGVVKVMGRYAGFIAAYATLASGDVDCVLVPELPVALSGPCSILEHLRRVVAAQSHAVVVVAEGACEEEMAEEASASGAQVEYDAGGNRKLPPVGPWLNAKIAAHFAAAGVKATVKYIDPSYMVRSVPASPPDAVYCMYLAQSAVHGAMAGFTGFSVGLVNNRLVLLPINAITANSPRRMNPRGRTVERLLQITRQPDPLRDPEICARFEARNAGVPKGHD